MRTCTDATRPDGSGSGSPVEGRRADGGAPLSAVSSVAANELGLGERQDRARFEAGTLPYLAPAMVLMAVLFLGPIVYSLYLAFTNLQLAGPHAVDYSF